MPDDQIKTPATVTMLSTSQVSWPANHASFCQLPGTSMAMAAPSCFRKVLVEEVGKLHEHLGPPATEHMILLARRRARSLWQRVIRVRYMDC